MSKKDIEVKCIRLQNILHPTKELCSEEKVYFHSHSRRAVIDYDGYFNLFFIEKHKKYTRLTDVSILLHLKGYTSISLMHNRTELETYIIDEPDIETINEYDFPYSEYTTGVFWFRLTKKEEVDAKVEGYFKGYAKLINPVKVFVDICTYKREQYVLRNMRRLAFFLDKDDNCHIREKLQIALIDNGQTLRSNSELNKLINDHPYIQVIENKNTGGAGGFTRGMREAIARKSDEKYTHVLLMDDDAAYEPDLLIRLFGMLETLNTTYKDATIGGAMWREDYPFIQHASGEWFENMCVINWMPILDMRSYKECTQKEMCSTANELERYSGWWCCCYSLNIVRDDNLPLPIFVHRDDIEFEKRNRKNRNPIIFINGIGVWHKPFESEYAGFKMYYDLRNTLIMTALHEPNISKKYLKGVMRRIFTGQCLNQRYLEMHLAYMGAMDFFKGFDWVIHIDPEKYHKKIFEYVKNNSNFIPLEQIEVTNKNEIMYKAEAFGSKISLKKLLSYKNKKAYELPKLKKYTLNGMLLRHKKGAAFITPDNGIWEDNFRYDKTVFYAPGSGKANLVKYDPRQLIKAIIMYLKFASALDKFDMNSYRRKWLSTVQKSQ